MLPDQNVKTILSSVDSNGIGTWNKILDIQQFGSF